MTDNWNCRIAEKQDTEQVKALWQQCFDDTPQFVNWYFDKYYCAEHTLGIFDHDQLQASAQVIPYQLKLRGTIVDCGYVVGVDTAPEARNKGYARTLLQECLKMQRQKKQLISLLMPFEGQFYYRYGWPFCYFHQQIKVKPQELRCAAKSWGTVRQADLSAVDTIKALQRIYSVFTTIYDGCVQRTEQNWKLLLEDAALEQTKCYVIEKGQVAWGYCLWTEIDDHGQKTALIREMAWCHADAKAGLLQFLMENVPEQQMLWLELPQDDLLSYQLAVSKTAAVNYPFLMARIVDVKQCLEFFQYSKEINIVFLLDVKDAFAPWNNSVFWVQIEKGRASVMAMKVKAEAGVHITIEGLSQLIMGARSVLQLQQQGELQANETGLKLMQQLWPKEKFLYINEYY